MIDVLINNAGGAQGLGPRWLRAKDEDWETMMQTNVLGLLRMNAPPVLPLMLKNPGGFHF